MNNTALRPGLIGALLGVIVWAGCTGPLAHHTPPESIAHQRLLPGPTTGGRVQLPNQWSLKPAGRHLPLGHLPLRMALSPDGRHLAVTHSGYGPQEIIIVNTGDAKKQNERIVCRVQLPNLWLGLVFGPHGRSLYASGGKDDLIYRFTFDNGYLSARRSINLYKKGKRRHPAGLAVSRDGRTLFAANLLDHSVAVVEGVDTLGQTAELDEQQDETNEGGETDDGDGGDGRAGKTRLHLSYIDLPPESFPYTCLLSPDERTLYVSLWGAARVAEVDLTKRAVRRLVATGDHPNDMVLTRDGRRLFVSNANDNTITVIDTARGEAVETLRSALYPQAPAGSTPNALALSPDEQFLLIANADNNNLALFEIHPDSASIPRGFIPTGWYPTAVLVHPAMPRIYVANGKGNSSRANVLGPQPGRPARSTTEYIGGLFTGTLSIIPWPSPKQLVALTKEAYACSPLREDAGVSATPDGPNPIPVKPGDPSPIQYCVYIVKENRTYDQVLGDVSKGNGDPTLCLFPARVTPNHHALAEEFVLLDNFYVEAEVSADGHEWSMGAYATDFVEKHWPAQYGHKGRHYNVGYPAEGSFAIAAPSAGYIWDRCAEAGVSYRSYGEFVNNGRTPADPGRAAVKSLEGHFDPWFRSYDLRYRDVDRAARFIAELRKFERRGDLPRFIVMRLPNDHTSGATPGMPTPTAMVADNDLALGMVVEALSHSRFWPQMAIFVVEDDAQNGPDHVDAHRTVAFVISPWVRRGAVDSSLYSTASMLRTMELILGLEPMSQFDAAARPMYASFTMQPDYRPYTCRPALVDLEEKNPKTAWGAEATLQMDLTKEDAIDDIRFNEIIWKSVRGADSPMPPPVRAAFVFPHDADDEDR
ncbi:MAG: alkaline phosphatase family protein [Candidatus Sumerlaeia bacterium]